MLRKESASLCENERNLPEYPANIWKLSNSWLSVHSVLVENCEISVMSSRRHLNVVWMFYVVWEFIARGCITMFL